MDTLIFRPPPFEATSREPACCARCGRPVHPLDREIETADLVDIATRPPSGTRSYGKPSSRSNPATTTDRCTNGKPQACPKIVGLEDVQQIAGVPFEYIGGGRHKPGIVLDRVTKRYRVANRIKNRVVSVIPRAGDGIATFIANMASAGLPLEAILSMGTLYCRCISSTSQLSNHSFGDAIDIGGLRFVGGREILVANAKRDPGERKLLHRANACLRLSFATVLDYHDEKRHWNHFHCDTNRGGPRSFRTGWPFVRESLGLPILGGFNKACADALRRFAGDPNAVKDRPALDRTLSQLFRREARRP
jgi:Extensin-like protein C-terminus